MNILQDHRQAPLALPPGSREGCFSSFTDERPDSVEVIIGWVRDAAAAVGADYIPGASHWIEGHPEWMASDGLHPNDDGYAEMARRMDAELATLGLKVLGPVTTSV